tara:strand:- start:1044 stop:1988 length:945 start_codon:yes stop_codon:yes gene_type:complete
MASATSTVHIKASSSTRTLYAALLLSVCVHAMALLLQRGTPKFEPSTLTYNNTVEVVLVNARSETAPVNAQAMAQVNLEGGGQAAPGVMASSDQAPAPQALTGSKTSKDRLETSNTNSQLQATQEQELRVLTALKDELASQAVVQISTTTDTDPSITLAQARQTRQRLLSHIGRIEQAIALDNASPKRRFISPATRAAVFALYYDHMRQTIEAQGTRNFPSYNQQRLYGQLVMAITVDAQGRVLGTRVLKEARQGALNQRAKALVAGMRFEPFPANLAAQASELVVVTQFDFLRDSTLSTQLLVPLSSTATPAQ